MLIVYRICCFFFLCVFPVVVFGFDVSFFMKNKFKWSTQEQELNKKLKQVDMDTGFSHVYIDTLHSNIQKNLKNLSFLSKGLDDGSQEILLDIEADTYTPKVNRRRYYEIKIILTADSNFEKLQKVVLQVDRFQSETDTERFYIPEGDLVMERRQIINPTPYFEEGLLTLDRNDDLQVVLYNNNTVLAKKPNNKEDIEEPSYNKKILIKNNLKQIQTLNFNKIPYYIKQRELINVYYSYLEGAYQEILRIMNTKEFNTKTNIQYLFDLK